MILPTKDLKPGMVIKHILPYLPKNNKFFKPINLKILKTVKEEYGYEVTYYIKDTKQTATSFYFNELQFEIY